MRMINSVLCLEFQDLLACGIPQRTLESWKEPVKFNDPSDNRKRLFSYKDLREKYKLLVQAVFGNPYEYIANGPIKSLVLKDFAAEKFFLEYRFDDEKALPTKYVEQYTTAASWLNMIVDALEHKRKLNDSLGLTVDQFWGALFRLIDIERIDLPTSGRRLRETVANYKQEGYKSLISSKFGNRNSAKIVDELSEALLFEMIAHPNQFNDVVIASQYNQRAQELSKDPICPSTVGNYRRKFEYLLMGSREGNKVWADKYGKSIPGRRPSAPLLLLNSDDNHLDLFYIDLEDKTGNKYFRRYKLIVVLDTFNDYPLGYAAAPDLSAALVKAAYLDAEYHIKELTGGWYLPHQIITDRWAKKELEPFYNQLGHFFPATTGLARAKYIEQSFSATWHNQLKWFNNYSGHNISAKSRGINQEALVARKKDFPLVEEAHQQIALFIDGLRQLPFNGNTISRQEQWKTAFKQSEKSQKKAISDEEMIYKLGIRHEHENTITKGRLKITMDGKSYLYDIPDTFYLQNVGKKVSTFYDPYDLSRILVTDNDKVRFIAPSHNPMPRALADYQPGDRARLNAAFNQKLAHVNEIGEADKRRKKVLADSGYDPEGLLQANIMAKSIKQNAEESILLRGMNADDGEIDVWNSI